MRIHNRRLWLPGVHKTSEEKKSIEGKPEFTRRYLELLSQWFGDTLDLIDDFDTVCLCELDFIEMMLIGELKFSINLLESPVNRTDFVKIIDFINWAETRINAKIQQ
ncbi:hypothetical protein LZ575_04785 [Antarcticibacterium sp. 1MA-6-2]|uniref:hypothetical protein n=1 Tax=Antarcticibacterium sp. 1MA-6-2 TaxID=2908210 RepID=UPI001F3F011F|nr:hypothetical protein [Antarcticibacterium sp. 1MA-6-2]UJH91955.1 hypothetical protein LZ575_04785 [Antarcticibacterium sp. 1MA-6-2]